MIEKLTPDHILGLDGLPTTIMPDSAKLMRKINELVDAVNSIVSVQEKLIDSRFVVETKHEAPAENVQDKFTEQRRWIGHLVEYVNADDGFHYGILTNIEPRHEAYPFEIDNGRDATADCWLPHESVFYKGE